MSDRIRLERTEIGDYVTLTPQGRVMYKIEEYQALKNDRDRWRDLCVLFEQHYICEDCSEKSATYLRECGNPLHAIHGAIYTWESENDEA
jgi:hypothetical protein